MSFNRSWLNCIYKQCITKQLFKIMIWIFFLTSKAIHNLLSREKIDKRIASLE